MEMRRQDSGKQEGNMRQAGPPEAGLRPQTLWKGTAYLDLQHADGLCLLEGDGLWRHHSDQDPVWRGRKVTSAPLRLSSFPCHVRRPKHRLWNQVNLGSVNLASHGQSDPG